MVLGDPSVADPAVSVGDQPGDGTLDHGTPLPVVVGEVALLPRSTRLDQQGVVGGVVVGSGRPCWWCRRGRSGQVAQRMPNTAWRVAVRVTVWPAGQVAVAATSAITKSSRPKRPALAEIGEGLDRRLVAGSARAARASPDPYAPSARTCKPRFSPANSPTPWAASEALARVRRERSPGPCRARRPDGPYTHRGIPSGDLCR